MTARFLQCKRIDYEAVKAKIVQLDAEGRSQSEP